MHYMRANRFRTTSKNIWKKLSRDGEIVLIKNDKPAAVLLNLDDDSENSFGAWKRERLKKLLDRIHAYTEHQGYLFKKEINAEISAARAEIQKKKRE